MIVKVYSAAIKPYGDDNPAQASGGAKKRRLVTPLNVSEEMAAYLSFKGFLRLWWPCKEQPIKVGH